MAAAAGASQSVAPVSLSDIRNRSDCINTTVTEWNVEKIVAMYNDPEATKSDATYLAETDLRVPKYQRKWSWKGARGKKKMEDLIDSMLHKFPVPPIILNQYTDGDRTRYDIYDGRHRCETVWRFVHNKFSIPVKVEDGDRRVLFRDLDDATKEHVLDMRFHVYITDNAPKSKLAEIFIRLNRGAPLKDKDFMWVNRDTPLISATIKAVERHESAFSRCFNVDLSKNDKLRNSLPNLVGLVCGLNQGDASMMTTSFTRLSDYLESDIDEERIEKGLAIIFQLFDLANKKYPVSKPTEMRKFFKLGQVIAFFYRDLTHKMGGLERP
jgi:hypothetical protein